MLSDKIKGVTASANIESITRKENTATAIGNRCSRHRASIACKRRAERFPRRVDVHAYPQAAPDGLERLAQRCDEHRRAYCVRDWKVRVWPVAGMLTV
jgi:hypothetical protein